MKKIAQKIKLKKFKSIIPEKCFKEFENLEFIVCYKDGSWEYVLTVDDLRDRLEKDYVKKIDYLFDLSDRISIERDVIIDMEEM